MSSFEDDGDDHSNSFASCYSDEASTGDDDDDEFEFTPGVKKRYNTLGGIDDGERKRKNKRTKRGLCSGLHVAERKGIEMYDMKPIAKPTIKLVLNQKGDPKVSTDVDLNVHFDFRDNTIRSNHRHWNLQAGIREVMANAHDAVFDQAADTMFSNNKVPHVETVHGDVGISGCVTMNGKYCISFCVSVEEVVLNPKYNGGKDTAYHPVKYIQADDLSKSDKEDLLFDTYRDRKYRVALFIRNVGSVLPVEAWVNSFSSKGAEESALLRECVIGGFGYGLKDAVLCLFRHGFDNFEVYAIDPMAKPHHHTDAKKFYRGMIESTRWCHHNAPTLRMKIVQSTNLSKSNKNVPKLVRNVCAGDNQPASTTVMIAAIVDKQRVEQKVADLINALRCHRVFGSDSYFDSIQIKDLIPRDTNDHKDIHTNASEGLSIDSKTLSKCDNGCSSSSSSSSSATHGDGDTIEVQAPCINKKDGKDKTFNVSVSVSLIPRDTCVISTWPGLQLLRFGPHALEYGKAGLVCSKRTRFDQFCMRFPDSFKQSTQRDRAYMYNNEIARLCGSSIVAACIEEEASKNKESVQNEERNKENVNIGDERCKFPDCASITSLRELRDQWTKPEILKAYPFNASLVLLLLDAISPYDIMDDDDVIIIDEEQGVNINIDSLISYSCTSSVAQSHISRFFCAFAPVINCDVRSADIARAAYETRKKHSRALQSIRNLFQLDAIGIPVQVPPVLMPLLSEQNKEFDVFSSVRKLLVQLSCVAKPFDPQYTVFCHKIQELVEAQRRRGLQTVIVELDISQDLISYVYEKLGSTSEVLKIQLTNRETNTYIRMQNFRRDEDFAKAYNEALRFDAVEAGGDDNFHEDDNAANFGIQNGGGCQIIKSEAALPIELIIMSSHEGSSIRDKVISICGQGNVWSQDYLRHSLHDPESIDGDANEGDEANNIDDYQDGDCVNDDDEGDSMSDISQDFPIPTRIKNEERNGDREQFEEDGGVPIKTEVKFDEEAADIDPNYHNYNNTGIIIDEKVGKTLVAKIRKELSGGKIICSSHACHHPVDVNNIMRPIAKVIRSACIMNSSR